MNTSEAALKGAFEALLRGDLAERDRLCDRAEALIKAEQRSSAIESVLSVDFYVDTRGRAVSSKAMARSIGMIQ